MMQAGEFNVTALISSNECQAYYYLLKTCLILDSMALTMSLPELHMCVPNNHTRMNLAVLAPILYLLC